MIKCRAIFQKSGRAVYISHLDLNRCMLRTFRRSQLPIWYTEGFNPHPYFSFALALSLGYSSCCEILDFNLNEDISFDEVKERLNSVMPEGMCIIDVYSPKMKITEIAKAEYGIELSSADVTALRDDIDKLLAQSEILIEKKSKKGIKTVDIKPFIELCSIESNENRMNIIMRLPAGTKNNINPSLFIDSLTSMASVEFETEKISRRSILCENNENFS